MKIMINGWLCCLSVKRDNYLYGIISIDNLNFDATVGVKAVVELGSVEMFAMVDKTIGDSESLVGRVGDRRHNVRFPSSCFKAHPPLPCVPTKTTCRPIRR